jgi:hypothetical protein
MVIILVFGFLFLWGYHIECTSWTAWYMRIAKVRRKSHKKWRTCSVGVWQVLLSPIVGYLDVTVQPEGRRGVPKLV